MIDRLANTVMVLGLVLACLAGVYFAVPATSGPVAIGPVTSSVSFIPMLKPMGD